MPIAPLRRRPRDERKLARLVAAAGEPTGNAVIDDAALHYLALLASVYVVTTLIFFGLGAFSAAEASARAIPFFTVGCADLAMVVRIVVRSARFRRAQSPGDSAAEPPLTHRVDPQERKLR